MSFSNPINVATASMEHIYERLCWLYATCLAIRSEDGLLPAPLYTLLNQRVSTL